MSDPERAEPTPASARSTHVAHLIPASWPEVAARIAPLVARVDRSASTVQVLVLVPSGDDVAELLRETLALAASADVRIAPLAAPRRAKRLAAASPQVVIGTVETVSLLIKSSALQLDSVNAVLLGAADELESHEAALEQVLAEVPKAAARILTSALATPFVERIMERHMHGARRVSAAPVDSAIAGATRPIEIRVVSSASPVSALGDVLEGIDAPVVAIVPADPRREQAVVAALTTLGFLDNPSMVRVVADGNTGGAPVVVLAGTPSPAVLAAVFGDKASRTIAFVTTRERAALAAAAPSATLTTFSPSAALGEAAAAEERQREQIRQVIRDGLPSREMLALEPLLAEFDPMVLAGAALKLYERARDGAKKPAEQRPAAAATPARSEAPRERSPRGTGPARAGGFSRGPRSFDGPPRSRGADDRGRPPRDRDGPPNRGPRPPFKPRGPRPTGGRDDR